MAIQVLFWYQVNPAASEEAGKLLSNCDNLQSDGMSWFKFVKKINITGRRKGIRQCGTKQRQLPNVVAPAQGRNLLTVNLQHGSILPWVPERPRFTH